MANPQKEAIQLMAEEVVRAIRKITDNNNRNYVNTQIRNAGTNTVFSGTIPASQVVGLYPTVASYIANAPSAAEQGDADAARIVVTMNGLADLQIQSATIDTAQIENLYGSYAEFTHLVATDATISGLDVEAIRGDYADLGLLKVNTANIGYGQIKDLVTGTAIIREGSAGALYVDRLKVNQAQIAGLEVGELIIESSVDHKLYRIEVDAQGNVTAVQRPITGGTNGDLGSGTVVGANIANSTITNGLIQDGTIKVAKLDVDDFFANSAVINKLETTLISSQTFGEDLDISQNSSILLTDQRIALVVDSSSTSSSLVLTNQMLQAIADKIALEADTIDLSANNTIQIHNASQIDVSAVNNLNLSSNNSVTINSGTQISSTAMDSIISTVTGSSAFTGPISVIGQKADRIDLIVTSASTASSIEITEGAINAISDQITLTADKINAVADDIELQGNRNVRIYSGDQLEAYARQYMDLSSNGTIKITSGTQITAEAVEGIDLTTNGTIKLLTKTNDDINSWMEFSDSLKIQKANSDWYTETSDTGFYVKNTQVVQAIAAFEGLATMIQSLIVGSGAQIKIVNDGSGGMAWVDV